MTRTKWALTLAHTIMLAMAACTLEPRYQRPDAPVAREWPTGAAYPPVGNAGTMDAALAADIGWRDFFTDPRLQRLIELALQNNRVTLYKALGGGWPEHSRAVSAHE